ncbi:MAG: hypothetical protein N2560_09990 [Ignavibacteria bacterium]|nr:hypothetical protein [Ignavibacteria bacterium]
MKKYYTVLILATVGVFLFATYYRIKPPVFIIKHFRFPSPTEGNIEQSQSEPSMHDVYSNSNQNTSEPIVMDTSGNGLIDSTSFPQQKKENKQILEKLLNGTNKNALIIVKSEKEKDFIVKISEATNKYELPKYLKKFTNKSKSDVELFFQENDFPLNLKNLETNKTYYLTTQDYKHFVTLIKVNELYSVEEIIDKGYLLDKSKFSIPDEILYPYSALRFWILPSFLILCLIPMYFSFQTKNLQSSTERLAISNLQKKTAKVFLTLAILSVVIATLVVALEFDIASGGGAILFVSLLLFVVFTILFFYYRKRAIEFEKIIHGIETLAIWEYEKTFWDNYVDYYLQQYQSINKSMFNIVAIVILIIFGIIILIEPSIAISLGSIGLGLIILLAIISRIVPKLSAKRMKNSEPICIIGKNCILIGRQFHHWGSFGNILEYAQIKKGELNILELEYSYPSRYGRARTTVYIPIPPDKLELAEAIVEKLTKSSS